MYSERGEFKWSCPTFPIVMTLKWENFTGWGDDRFLRRWQLIVSLKHELCSMISQHYLALRSTWDGLKGFDICFWFRTNSAEMTALSKIRNYTLFTDRLAFHTFILQTKSPARKPPSCKFYCSHFKRCAFFMLKFFFF